MRILSAKIEHARYVRDFGQVEALVAFLVKDQRRPVPHTLRIRTADYPHASMPLRKRLIASAAVLLHAMHAAETARFTHAA